MDLSTLVILISSKLLLLSALLLVWARIGRRIDDHRVCQRCRYDLQHSSGVTCPECGSDLTAARAVRLGNRRPRPWASAIATLLILLSLAAFGLAVQQMDRVNWYHYKPFAWTLRSALAQAGTPNEPNVLELQRRLSNDELSAAQIRSLTKAALKVQGAPNTAWSTWQLLLDSLFASGALTQDQVFQYVQQAIKVELNVKPALRRQQRFAFQIRCTALIAQNKITSAIREAEPLLLGDVPIGTPSDFSYQERTGFNIVATYPASWPPDLSAARNGPTELRTAFTYRLTFKASTRYAPVMVRVPVSAPTRLLPEEALADTFIADPHRRQAMQDGWSATRVQTSPNGGRLRLCTQNLPVALSASVWLQQYGESWKVGYLHVPASQPRTWDELPLADDVRQPRDGEVTVELRPDQEASDHCFELDTYWGESMTRRVVVNAPYTPPLYMDPSLAPAMERAIQLKHVMVASPGQQLRFRLLADGVPWRIGYLVHINTGSGWREVGDPVLRALPSFQVASQCDYDVKLYADESATTFDILLVPDFEWEEHRAEWDPPWGYPILFKDVPLPPAEQRETPGDVIHGKAVLDESVLNSVVAEY